VDTQEQISNRNSTAKAEEIAALLKGVDTETLALALESIKNATKATEELDEQKLKCHQEKEIIWGDENAYIYRRGNTKKRYWYLRIYNKDTKQRYVKSLETTDKVKAVTEARVIYQQITDKMSRGEKLSNLLTADLVKKYLAKEELKITDIPKQGITKGRFRVKKQCYDYWIEYLTSLGLDKTPIDMIAPDKTRNFGYWLQQLPKRGRFKASGDTTPRSSEVINNVISEILKCYKDVAVRDRYISRDQVPDIDKLTHKDNR